MMALSQLGIRLHFCLKDLGSLILGYASKFKNKILKQTEVKFIELENNV